MNQNLTLKKKNNLLKNFKKSEFKIFYKISLLSVALIFTFFSLPNTIEFLSKRTGDYFLLDGGDCTSLMASIEVLRNSNAKMILKKHVEISQ